MQQIKKAYIPSFKNKTIHNL